MQIVSRKIYRESAIGLEVSAYVLALLTLPERGSKMKKSPRGSNLESLLLGNQRQNQMANSGWET
jgi:hypothetical protein